MFDWPEQIQTSPASTSLKVRVFLPLTVIVYGPPVGSGSSITSHFPFGPALAVLPWSLMVTVTSSPGSAQPQTRSFCSRWRTMWSLKMAGSFTSARAGSKNQPATRQVRSPQRGLQIAIACNPSHNASIDSLKL